MESVLDHDKEELIAEYERGAFRPVKNQDSAKQEAMEAARRYTRKDARITIRLSAADLDMLKRRAAKEGFLYQSLIAGILHQYIRSLAPQTNELVCFRDRYLQGRIGSHLTQYKIRRHLYLTR